MLTLRRFSAISSADRHLIVQALLFVGLVRLGLWLLPFRVLRYLLRKLMRTRLAASPGSQRMPIERISWAVSAASRYVPAATCLTQALAGKILLYRQGYQSSVRVGVARNEGGKFLAHAWVESGNNVVIGGSGDLLSRYTVLASAGKELF